MSLGDIAFWRSRSLNSGYLQVKEKLEGLITNNPAKPLGPDEQQKPSTEDPPKPEYPPGSDGLPPFPKNVG
jgi:hypothetical protein